MASVTDTVQSVLPARAGTTQGVDIAQLQSQLDEVAEEALLARTEGLGLAQAVADPRFAHLGQFHRDLRDAMFVEIPRELQSWVEGLQNPQGSDASTDLGRSLTSLARQPGVETPSNTDLQRALAELMLFEAVRLRLLVATWQSDEFEQLGGEEQDIDAIAWDEVSALLRDPLIDGEEVRPLRLMFASASVALARDAASRADDLRRSSGDVREELKMRAKLRSALRELRLPESVLLENALGSLLGHDRVELRDLQEQHPVALAGMTRQAMDQRVSRGRRALTGSRGSWPRRRRPALFDLLRAEQPTLATG